MPVSSTAIQELINPVAPGVAIPTLMPL